MQQYTIGRLFSRAIQLNFVNRLKRKFEETIFTNLHWCLSFSLMWPDPIFVQGPLEKGSGRRV